MLRAFKLNLAKKQLFKLRVELGGVEAEMVGINQLVKRTGQITNGQRDRIAVLSRRLGELRTACTLTEELIKDLTPVKLLDPTPRTFHSLGEQE